MPNVAFLTDLIDSLTVYKDSSLAMIWAAQKRDWHVFHLRQQDLIWVEGRVFLDLRPISLTDAYPNATAIGECVEVGTVRRMEAAELDVIFMRKDPPFDMNYVNATYHLEEAQRAGPLVINNPQSLRDCNEKFFTTAFPDYIPPQVITQKQDVLLEFTALHRDVVLKPLDGMGGRGVVRVSEGDSNLVAIIEMLTKRFSTPIVAQRYLAEIEDGDKRILLIDGAPFPYALARIPTPGEMRGNLAAGGLGVVRRLSRRDEEIASAIGPELRRRGLVFAGIDVIGDCLTEVNVTCPTCIRELDAVCEQDIAGQLMDTVASKL